MMTVGSLMEVANRKPARMADASASIGMCNHLGHRRRVPRCHYSMLGEEREHHILDEFVAIEILSRLPVKSLIRFKSVCKAWRGLISDQYFVALYGKRAKERPPRLLMLTYPFKRRDHLWEIDMYMYDDEAHRSRQTANFFSGVQCRYNQDTLYNIQHANGLLLLITPTGVVVCNPSTHESIALPESTRIKRLPIAFLESTRIKHLPAYRIAFGYVPSTNTSKVVLCAYGCSLFFDRNRITSFEVLPLGVEATWRAILDSEMKRTTRFEVLTLGVDTSWRDILDNPPYTICPVTLPTVVGEIIYYRTYRLVHPSAPKAFLSFDLRDEKFGTVYPPSQHLTTDFYKMRIVDLEGRPCFVYCSEEGMKYELWISEDNRKHTWIPTFSFSLSRLSDYLQARARPYYNVQPLAVRQGKLLLNLEVDGYHSLEYYDPQSNSFEPLVDIEKDLAFYNRKDCALHFFTKKARLHVLSNFVESLVSLGSHNHRYAL